MPTSITLTWPANPASEAIQNYTVWESKNGGAYANLGNVTTPEKFINAPLPGVYKWKVTATNFVGVGPFSNEADGPGLPSAPGDIVVVVAS